MLWSSYLRLSKLATLIVVMGFVPMQNVTALPSIPVLVNEQAQSQISEDLDVMLAKFYETYASPGSFEERIHQAIETTGSKPQEIKIVKTTETPFVGHLPVSAYPPGSSPRIEVEVANCDLIIIGTPVKAHTLPIANRSFLFTEYAVRVEKVISGDQNHVLPEDTIIVSRGGGELMVNGVLVKAIEPAFSEFDLNQSYVLMLRAIPGTTTYRALGSGTFALRDGEVTSASGLEKGRIPKKDIPHFMSEVDTAVARKRSGRN